MKIELKWMDTVKSGIIGRFGHQIDDETNEAILNENRNCRDVLTNKKYGKDLGTPHVKQCRQQYV